MKKMAVILSLILVLGGIFAPTSVFARESTYAETLFDLSKIIEIDIQMDEEAWDQMIKTASSEEYSSCNVVVNGVLYENVGIRPKGNSSMSSVTSRGSERYSWRIKFDKFVKKQFCDGLDVLILNNGFKDPGELREAIAYDMYRFLEADASLYNYAVVSLNGEYFGVYLALECVDESFAERNFGDDYGQLYKPDVTNMNRRNNDEDGESEGESEGGSREREAAEDGEWPAGDSNAAEGETQAAGDSSAAEGETTAAGERAEGESNGDSQGQRPARAEGESNGERAEGESDGESAGARSNSELAMALNYVDDNLETYQEIWDSAKFKSDDEEAEHTRVVEALKHVCQGDNIGDYLYVDNFLKYFAIQTYVYNHDGLTGNVNHNYYLYEQDGKLNMFPWDLNESFTVSGTGSDYVNFPIDTPFTTNDLSQRSFFMSVLANEEYLAQYHEYLRQLSEEYALGGELEKTMERILSQISELVETDPTSFATYDEFIAASDSLVQAVQWRAKGVLGQLSGEIPSTKEGQAAEPEKLLDPSEADFSGISEGGGMGDSNGDSEGGSRGAEAAEDGERPAGDSTGENAEAPEAPQN